MIRLVRRVFSNRYLAHATQVSWGPDVHYFLWPALIPPAAAFVTGDYHSFYCYLAIWAYFAVWLTSLRHDHRRWGDFPPPWYFWIGYLVMGAIALSMWSSPSYGSQFAVVVGSGVASFVLFHGPYKRALQTPSIELVPPAPPPDPPKHTIAPSASIPTSDITEAARKLAEKRKL